MYDQYICMYKTIKAFLETTSRLEDEMVNSKGIELSEILTISPL